MKRSELLIAYNNLSFQLNKMLQGTNDEAECHVLRHMLETVIPAEIKFLEQNGDENE